MRATLSTSGGSAVGAIRFLLKDIAYFYYILVAITRKHFRNRYRLIFSFFVSYTMFTLYLLSTCKSASFSRITKEWANWSILQDPEGVASVSMAELMPKDCGDLELGEIDDQSVVKSIASQKCKEVVLDTPGMPIVGNMNPLVDFQLLDYERRHDPRKGDVTSKGSPTACRLSCQKGF